jgi:hypothetical protein
MLDCWRHLGHLYFRPVVADSDPYVENRAYARFILTRSAASNPSAANHPVAFRGVLKRAKKPATTEAVLLALPAFALKAPEEPSARTAFSFVAVTLAGILLAR